MLNISHYTRYYITVVVYFYWKTLHIFLLKVNKRRGERVFSCSKAKMFMDFLWSFISNTLKRVLCYDEIAKFYLFKVNEVGGKWSFTLPLFLQIIKNNNNNFKTRLFQKRIYHLIYFKNCFFFLCYSYCKAGIKGSLLAYYHGIQ